MQHYIISLDDDYLNFAFLILSSKYSDKVIIPSAAEDNEIGCSSSKTNTGTVEPVNQDT